ncbi:MAG TPA: aminoglycoside 3-N-acetyltransferase [Gaiella sp.]|nr:aminoglycoside 3-N-acetyltransferase [Gaiella sp.]
MVVGRTRLARELSALGLRGGAVILVHCRMSALGTVVGGAETVVRALLDVVGPEGTLVAYVGWDDAPPDDPDSLAPGDRELFLAEQPVYDPAVARARRDHGRIAEVLRTWPGAVHSRHPEAGVAAVGRDADAVALPHPLDDAYGHGTPYARVVEHGGQVVLLGAPLDTVTLVHHAEAIARVPGKRRVAWRCPVLVQGRREWRTLHDIDTGRGALSYERLTGGVDYVEYFARATLERGAGRCGPLGAGTGHVFEARRLTESTVDAIESAFAQS